jgi:hypothetical protein
LLLAAGFWLLAIPSRKAFSTRLSTRLTLVP